MSNHGQSATKHSNAQISNQLNLIVILLLGLIVFNFYLFFKVRSVEKELVSGSETANVGAGNESAQQQASPLSIDKLKAYASELKLNKRKFESCLDNGDKSSLVKEDMRIGRDLGVQGTPGYFINGKFLGGAFPVENFKEIIDKELSGNSSPNCADYSEDLQKYCQTENGSFNPESVDVPIRQDTPFWGKESAPVAIVEFSDFECPYCKRSSENLKEIKNAYPDSIKIYHKQFPLDFHPNAFKASEAALCAHDQRKYVEFHEKLFSL